MNPDEVGTIADAPLFIAIFKAPVALLNILDALVLKVVLSEN